MAPRTATKAAAEKPAKKSAWACSTSRWRTDIHLSAKSSGGGGKKKLTAFNKFMVNGTCDAKKTTTHHLSVRSKLKWRVSKMMNQISHTRIGIYGPLSLSWHFSPMSFFMKVQVGDLELENSKGEPKGLNVYRPLAFFAARSNIYCIFSCSSSSVTSVYLSTSTYFPWLL